MVSISNPVTVAQVRLGAMLAWGPSGSAALLHGRMADTKGEAPIAAILSEGTNLLLVIGTRVRRILIGELQPSCMRDSWLPHALYVWNVRLASP